MRAMVGVRVWGRHRGHRPAHSERDQFAGGYAGHSLVLDRRLLKSIQDCIPVPQLNRFVPVDGAIYVCEYIYGLSCVLICDRISSIAFRLFDIDASNSCRPVLQIQEYATRHVIPVPYPCSRIGLFTERYMHLEGRDTPVYHQTYLPSCAQRPSRPHPPTAKTRASFHEFVELVQREYQRGTITSDQQEGLIRLAACSFLEAMLAKNVESKFCEIGEILTRVEEQVEDLFSH